VRSIAKDIRAKYVAPPHTTEFAVMFLPTERLFAEVIRRPGLVDWLQSECRVIVAGPAALVSLLTSMRIGFSALAIQQSSVVWQVLSAVKTEFEKFGDTLDRVHKKLDEAQRMVEEAGVRRRAVDRKLRGVEVLREEISETE
jgi:DNA recombination protein RmuC